MTLWIITILLIWIYGMPGPPFGEWAPGLASGMKIMQRKVE
jgi:hypothetical protein